MRSRTSLTLGGVATMTLAVLFVAAAADAATPASYAKLDQASSAACSKVSGLRNARVGPVTRFSDRTGLDARLVTGTWPQPHMKGASATMLCLYNRRSRIAEAEELAGGFAEAALVQAVGFKDRRWPVKAIDGRPPAVGGNAAVTLMFGSDGHIAANGGCNGFGGRYMLTGEGLKIYGPMIGTQMACAATVMEQEQRFQAILSAAQSLIPQPDGGWLLTDADRRTVLLGPADGEATAVQPERFASYRCGDRFIAVNLLRDRAIVQLDGERIDLPLLDGGDPAGPRLFTNGRITLFQTIDGPEQGLSLAMGRAAAQRCTPEAAG